MRANGSTYLAHTRQLLALLRAVAAAPHTPATLTAAIGISAPTLYRMLNEIEPAFGAAVAWDAASGAYRITRWGVISAGKMTPSTCR